MNAAACRGIAEETVEQAWHEMQAAGAIVLPNAEKIKDYLKSSV